MLPIEFQVNWPYVSGEAKNRFSRFRPLRPSWISDRNDFSYFWFTIYPRFTLIGLSVQEEKRKIDFKDGGHGGHLGFPIEIISATFDQQVTPMLHTKFQFNWSFGSGEEAKNRFSRWQLWRQSWIFDRNDFSYFRYKVTPTLPTKFQANWPSGFSYISSTKKY